MFRAAGARVSIAGDPTLARWAYFLARLRRFLQPRGDCAEELVTSLEFLVADLKFGHYAVWYLGPVHLFRGSILGSVAGGEWVPDQK
jgi:hypothetical protein